ncbi:MAG: hypothetical protein GC181_02805 [Bacteroidetes bacterium]|nr:hypothetical protein [Bacteroidota bacterium]
MTGLSANAQDHLREGSDTHSWLELETDHFHFFHEEGSGKMIQSIVPDCILALQKIEGKIGYRLSGRLDIYVHRSNSEMTANYATEDFDKNKDLGGFTAINLNNIHVYFNGSTSNLINQIRDGVAENLILEMIYGGTVQERIKYATLLHLPLWFVKGLSTYLSREWDAEADNILRDGINNDLFRNFNSLNPERQKLVGRSMWHYLEVTEGPTTIQRILYLVRLTRKVETALVFVTRRTSKQIFDDWHKTVSALYATELKRRLPTDPEPIAFPLYESRLMSCTISDDGNKVACSFYQDGKFKVVVFNINTGEIQEIYSRYFLYNGFEPDEHSIVLCWEDNNLLWVVLNDVQPRLLKYESTGELISEDDLPFDCIHSFDYSPINKELIFSGIKNGQSDLFLYNPSTLKLNQLSNDIADDVYPNFDRFGNIYFSRSIRNPEDEFALPTFDIFHLILNGYEVLSKVNISETPGFNEILPFKLTSEMISFISDRNGIYNAYAYNSASEIFALSDYQSGILLQSVNKTRSHVAELMLRSGVIQLYVSEIGPNAGVGSTLHPTSTLAVKEYIEEHREEPVDSIEPFIFNDTVSSEKIYFQSAFPIPQNVDSLETIAEENILHKQYPTLQVPDNYLVLYPSGLFLQLNNSNFLTSRMPDFRPPESTLLNKFGFVLGMRMEDQYKLHNISLRLRSSTRFDRFQFLGEYTNRKGKFIEEIKLASDGYVVDRSEGASRITYRSYSISVIRPFKSDWFAGIHHSMRNDVFRPLSTDEASFGLKAISRTVFTEGFSAGINRTFREGRWTHLGWKAKYAVELQVSDKKLTSAVNQNFQASYGKKVLGRFTWFSIMKAGHSSGVNRTVYFLGGNQNNVQPTYKNNPMISSGNWFYQPVYGVRNNPINIRNGNSFAFINSEFHVPVHEWIARRPLRNQLLQNLDLIAFTDVGTAWYGRSPYDKKNPANITFLSSGALNITIYNIRNPLVYSFGSGLRSVIFGYDIRYDLAWTYDNNIWGKHIHCVSLGKSF